MAANWDKTIQIRATNLLFTQGDSGPGTVSTRPLGLIPEIRRSRVVQPKKCCKAWIEDFSLRCESVLVTLRCPVIIKRFHSAKIRGMYRRNCVTKRICYVSSFVTIHVSAPCAGLQEMGSGSSKAKI